MITQLSDLFPILLLTVSSSLLFSPLLIRIAPRIGLMDIPGSAPHKTHLIAMPAVGGLAIGLSLAAAYLLLELARTWEVNAILLGGLAILLLGIVDDSLDLVVWQKLIGQLAIASLMILMNVQVLATRVPTLDLALTILWFVGIVNAFNFVDSMDGLALGLAAIASSFFMLVMLDSGQPQLSILAATLLGTSIGLYVFNASPARLFLGDSGSQLLGFLLASLGVAYVPGRAGLPQGVSWFTPILLLAVPIFDTALVIMSRIKRGVPIYRGGQDHLYHCLIAKGFDKTRSVLLMQLAAVMSGLVAFIALESTVFAANTLFVSIVLLALLLALYLGKWNGNSR